MMIVQYTADLWAAEQAQRAARRQALLGQMSATAHGHKSQTQKLAEAHAASLARKVSLGLGFGVYQLSRQVLKAVELV